MPSLGTLRGPLRGEVDISTNHRNKKFTAHRRSSCVLMRSLPHSLETRLLTVREQHWRAREKNIKSVLVGFPANAGSYFYVQENIFLILLLGWRRRRGTEGRNLLWSEAARNLQRTKCAAISFVAAEGGLRPPRMWLEGSATCPGSNVYAHSKRMRFNAFCESVFKRPIQGE